MVDQTLCRNKSRLVNPKALNPTRYPCDPYNPWCAMEAKARRDLELSVAIGVEFMLTSRGWKRCLPKNSKDTCGRSCLFEFS